MMKNVLGHASSVEYQKVSAVVLVIESLNLFRKHIRNQAKFKQILITLMTAWKGRDWMYCNHFTVFFT